ncbi:branched-chain amino acid ABC transporter permease [Rhodoplanes sp. SY1]|uniref:branched-chain amino acid ABC transporter permease n=1 Tax=Rhodoplanes sp. SY1 TaxID=3166646 RepID=UPI0038B60FCC
MLDQILSILVDGVLLGLIYAITGLGLSLVLGVMGIVNVAHSAFVMLGSFLAFELFRRFGVDPVVAFVVALPVFFLLGTVVYRVLVTRLETAAQTQGLVAMFGLMVLIENLGTIVWTTDTRVITASYTNASLAVGGLVLPYVRLIAGGLALGLIGLFWGLLRFTLTGRAIRAMGQNPEAARIVGVDIRRLSAIMFGLGIACAGAAGVALAMVFPFSPNTQVVWLAWAFLVVVLGGLGSVENTLFAGVAVGLIQSVCTAVMPFDYVYLVLYVLLAVILMVRREGLSSAVRRTI